MKVTVARHNKDRYIIIESEEKTIICKAKMLMKTSEIHHTDIADLEYESEVFEATFLREENEMLDKEKERILGALHYKDENGKMRT